MIFEKEEILPATNPRSPFYKNLPSQDAKPVDELVKYFKYYKNLIKNLINYFKEISLIKEFESNLNYQILNSYHKSLSSGSKVPLAISPNPVANAGYVGSGSISNGGTPPDRSTEKRPMLLKSKSSTQGFTFAATGNKFYDTTNSIILTHHHQMHTTSLKHYKELINRLIPKLENLLKNLSNKIKEIRSSLRNDSFVNDSIIKEISKTGSVLNKYMNSVELYNTQKDIELNEDNENDEQNANLDDAFLVKLRLNYQLKNQLIKENYLFAAFVNLQNISKDLLVYILKDLQGVLEKFEKISSITFKPYLNFNANVEWENFIVNNKNFLNIYRSVEGNDKKEIRQFKNLIIPYSNSIHNKCIRFGIIYKKSKVLKNYNRYYYLLTCNYLHEFKLDPNSNSSSTSSVNAQPNDPNQRVTSPKGRTGVFITHNDVPEKSYNLNNYSILIKNDKNYKFNLVEASSGKQTSFKCNNAHDFNNWVSDLGDLLQFEDDFKKRFEFVETKLASRVKADSRTKPSLQSKGSSSSQIPQVPDTPMSLDDSLDSNQGSIALPEHINLVPNENSLQGIFTPNIHTPSSSGSDRNPFDQSFHISTAEGSSPGKIPITSGTDNGSGTGSRNSGSNVTSPGSINHENYLKIQQEYLKQQQEIISKKLKETQIAKDTGKPIKKVTDNLQFANVLPPATEQQQQPAPSSQPISSQHLPIHRATHSLTSINSNSLESIKSLNPSSINNFLQANENLMVPQFFITDEDDVDKEQKE